MRLLMITHAAWEETPLARGLKVAGRGAEDSTRIYLLNARRRLELSAECGSLSMRERFGHNGGAQRGYQRGSTRFLTDERPSDSRERNNGPPENHLGPLLAVRNETSRVT